MPENPLLHRLMQRRRIRVVTTPPLLPSDDGREEIAIRKPDQLKTSPSKRRATTTPSPSGSDSKPTTTNTAVAPLMQLLDELKLGTPTKLLGTGTYGSVYRLVNTAERLPVVAAVKVMDYGPKSAHINAVVEECRVTSRLCSLSGGHPHLVTSYGYALGTSATNCAALFLELCNADTLSHWTRDGRAPLPLPELARQLVSAVAYCHRNGWAHCDIAPKNILVTSFGDPPSSYVIKLCDFSSARKIGLCGRLMLKQRKSSSEYPEEICSISHRSPENLASVILHTNKLWGMSDQIAMTDRVDSWSLGLVLVECALLIDNILHISTRTTREHTFERYIELFGMPCSADWWVPSTVIRSLGPNTTIKRADMAETCCDNKITTLVWPRLIDATLEEPGLYELIRKLLKWDPNKRASVCAVDAALK
jgi:serine/threonine protein kinase